MIAKRTAVFSETLSCCNIHSYKDAHIFYEYEIIGYYENKARYERPLLSKKQIEQLYRSYRLPFMGYIKKTLSVGRRCFSGCFP